MLSVLLSALCPPAPLKSLTFWRYTNQIIIIIDHRSRLPFISPLGDDICWVSVFQRGLRDAPTDSLLALILPARSRSCHTLNFVKALKRTPTTTQTRESQPLALSFLDPPTTEGMSRTLHQPSRTSTHKYMTIQEKNDL